MDVEFKYSRQQYLSVLKRVKEKGTPQQKAKQNSHSKRTTISLSPRKEEKSVNIPNQNLIEFIEDPENL